ncbi:DoxX family protein [Streptomyces sp. NPDC001250]|uniref:DoxX family protein n=1 Tax=unclassified Streptomyces TaxID=2593676 RepID=UPI003323C731
MFIATVVLTALLALGFVGAGLPKALAQPAAMSDAERFGYPVRAFRYIGLLELGGVAGLIVGLWYWPVGVAAAAGLLLVCGGALRAHLRAGDAPKALAPAALFGVTAVAVLITRIASS